MGRLVKQRYLKRFENYVYSQALEHGLLRKEGRYLLAVSGGLDSMCLLELFNRFKCSNKIIDFRVIHINHLTRGNENLRDWKLVEEYCLNENISFVGKKIGKLPPQRDIENTLRGLRRKLLLNELEAEEELVMGHHLDDSYEWSFIQAHRSSNMESSLGIPMRNGRIIRPFLVASKDQLKNFASYAKTPFNEDSSNSEQRFTRNYLRTSVLPSIKKAFPRYLKHYAYQQNALAQKLGVHLNSSKDNEKQKKCMVFKRTNGDCLIKFSEGMSKLEKKELLSRHMKDLSSKNRGTWAKQLDKLHSMLESKHSKGPLVCSGGLFLYSFGSDGCLISREYSPLSLSELRKLVTRESQIPVVF